MKKYLKIVLIAALCAVAAGIALVTAAFAGTDFNFGKFNTVSYKEVITPIEGEFEKISVSELSGNVTLVTSEDGECKAVCSDSDKLSHIVKVENGTLSITVKDERRWIDFIGINFTGVNEVTVYLPESAYAELEVSTKSGGIRISEGFTFEKVTLESSSGTVVFTSDAAVLGATSSSGGISAEGKFAELALNSSSGSINMKAGVTGKAVLSTTSGQIRISDSAVGEIDARSKSGSVRLSSLAVSGKAYCETKSGSVELADFDAADINIETSSGNVSGTLSSPKIFDVRSSSGTCNVPESTPNVGMCVIRTSSGNVRINIGQ